MAYFKRYGTHAGISIPDHMVYNPVTAQMLCSNCGAKIDTFGDDFVANLNKHWILGECGVDYSFVRLAEIGHA